MRRDSIFVAEAEWVTGPKRALSGRGPGCTSSVLRLPVYVCLNKRSYPLNEALPERGHASIMTATPAVADPCDVVILDDDTASQAAALVDALRRKRGHELPVEIVDAQDSLER